MKSTICERLHEGQAIAVTGKYLLGEGFLAVEISPGEAEAEITCLIHAFDAQRRFLRIFEHTLALAPQVEVKDLEGELQGFAALQAGRMIKLKGKFEPAQGFQPEKIKLRETREFNIEEMQGVITRVEREAQRVYLNGIPVLINDRTILEEINGNFES
jgi:hypothetical protein